MNTHDAWPTTFPLSAELSGRVDPKTVSADMPVAGGSALIDVADLPHISDRMRQALVDMSAVRRSLRLADWAKVTGGIELERQRVYYTGQSLGGILGAVFVAVTDDVERAVLNVPGADLVGLFRESTYFKPQMDAFLDHEKLVDGSYEQARLLGIARWLMDTVDPHSVAHLLAKKKAMMQMSNGDIIIPNRVTERLQRASALPMETYPSPLHAVRCADPFLLAARLLRGGLRARRAGLRVPRGVERSAGR